MRIVLVGAVVSSRIALATLIEAGYPPEAVITLPLEKASRHSDFTDLRPLAASAGIALVEAANVNAPEIIARLRQLQPDYVFVIGWSQICRAEFLELARRGSIGFHPAPLPKNRGRAVIPWTILQGLSETGTTLFWMDEGMDSGEILAQELFPVAVDETAASLYTKHLDALRRMLRDSLPALATGAAPRRAQDHSEATYCARRTAADGLIDWRAPAGEVWTLIRAAGRPYPGAFTYLGRHRLRIWDADVIGPAPYWGLPGQIQRLDERGALVQCGDREHVLLRELEVQGEGVRAALEVLKIHEKLGINMHAVMNERNLERFS